MKPTEESPETKEQFETQESPNLYQGVKISCPPNCKISLGLDLSQIFFNKILTTIIIETNPAIHIKKISFNKNSSTISR